MNLKNFIEGLNTLRPYYEDPDGYHLGAEHDQIYAYATDKPLTEEDVQKMLNLGWFQPESGEDDSYSPEDGWSTFV